MANPLDRVASFPTDLTYLLTQLEEGEDQDFLETPVDRGPPRRRATTAPYSVLRGTVQIDGPEKTLLINFSNENSGRRFFIFHPTTQKKMLAWFRNGTPFLKVQRLNAVGTPHASETHTVNLDLGMIDLPGGSER